MLTISTINVNGLRAAVRKGFLDWLAAGAADVVCLQEIRAQAQQLSDDMRQPAGWYAVHAHCELKGRSGVSIFTRRSLEAVRIGFGEPEFNASGRYIEIDFPELTIGSLYLPSGEVGTVRQTEKERFMAAFLPYLAQRREKVSAQGRELLICGDWNIAHREIDLKNWKSNQQSSGFLPEERAWLSRVFDEAQYVDVVRALHPEGPGPYSWWSYRGRAFERDAGWRIDYHVATAGLAARARHAVVERAVSYEARWSDHAPVTVSYDY